MLARRERENEARGRKLIEERKKAGLSPECYNSLPAAAKAHILALEKQVERGRAR
jgi:hypothetical protein